MSTLSATVNTVSYPVHIPSGYTLVAVLEMRDVLTFTIIDSPGTAVFTRGMPVTFSDSVTGKQYDGYVQSDDPKKLSPNPTSTILLHTLTCMDHQYDVDKVANENPYSGGWHAGDIATDMAVNNKLAAEGVLIAAALRHETTTADFGTGTLTNTVGSVAIPSNDGDLELASAGSTVTITEATTAQFGTGTLTNMVAANNALSPSTVSGLMVSVNLPLNENGSYITYNIWSGSFTIGSSDTLNYSIWLPSTNAANNVCGVDLLLSDGTLMSALALTDQSGVTAAPTSLSSYASKQWYTRAITLTGLTGKSIKNVYITFKCSNADTYTAYFKNIYLGSQSGSPFFATNATTTNVNPISLISYQGYASILTTSAILQVFDPATSLRTSTAYSIDAVKLLKSSYVTWTTGLPGSTTFSLNASYDGGVTYTPCVNNSALPALPAGSNIASTTITLQESFGAGDDPSQIPSLITLAITLLSAPNATKSDIVTAFATQSAFNTGTYSFTQALSNGDLTLVGTTRDWNDNLVTNQTLFNNGSGITQTASGGQFVFSVPVSTSVNEMGYSRLDFIGTLTDFILDIDVNLVGSYNVSSVLWFVYRQTYWGGSPTTDNGTGGYTLKIPQGGGSITVVRGTNSSTNAATGIASVSGMTVTHIKLVCIGNHHQFYFNNSTTASLDFTDGTFLSGEVALGGFTFFQNPGGSPNTGVFDFDNLVVSNTTGTWTGPSTSINSLGTCGTSVIAWTQAVPTAVVQTSIDGGSTYQVCTNGGQIPNLTPGTNVSGKSVIVKATLYMASQTVQPVLRQLFWRVLGQYPTVTGTRTTAPLGIDNMTRADAGTWGTAQDGQAWNKTGTGTVAISSNTATISNTTGDVDEQIGSKTATDQEDTVQIELSASTIQGGIKLRYSNATNYYKLALSTTALSIVKNTGGGESTLATAAGTYNTNTFYYLRFRAVGSSPVLLYGKVWLGDGSTIEPGVSAGVMSSSNPAWTVTASD